MRIRLTQTLVAVPSASNAILGRVFEAQLNQHSMGYGDVCWFIVGDDGTDIGVRGFEAMVTLELPNYLLVATVDIQYMIADFSMGKIPAGTKLLAWKTVDPTDTLAYYTQVMSEAIGLFDSEVSLWQP